MKRDPDQKKNNFKKIIEISTDYIDADALAKELNMTVMTARKYMRVMIDVGVVTAIQEKNRTKGLRKIKAAVSDLNLKTLAHLCEHYKFMYALEMGSGEKVRDTPKQVSDRKSGIVRMFSSPSAEMIEKLKEQSKRYRKEMRSRSVGYMGGSSSLNGIY